MIDDHRISPETWRAAWHWYRDAPHQVDAVNLLFEAIWQSDPALLHENAEWFRRYRDRDKLVHSFTHPEGE